MQGGVLSEDIVQPAMFWGPLAAGAARARRRPAHSFPVKKQQNISVIKTEGPGDIALGHDDGRSYDDLARTRACPFRGWGRRPSQYAYVYRYMGLLCNRCQWYDETNPDTTSSCGVDCSCDLACVGPEDYA